MSQAFLALDAVTKNGNFTVPSNNLFVVCWPKGRVLKIRMMVCLRKKPKGWCSQWQLYSVSMLVKPPQVWP